MCVRIGELQKNDVPETSESSLGVGAYVSPGHKSWVSGKIRASPLGVCVVATFRLMKVEQGRRSEPQSGERMQPQRKPRVESGIKRGPKGAEDLLRQWHRSYEEVHHFAAEEYTVGRWEIESQVRPPGLALEDI